jgi:hypothetical protein
MRSFNQILIAISCSISSYAFALETFADFLYWQASESAEWALINNFNASNQTVSYQTIGFKPAPGFRVGLKQDIDERGVRFTYTHFDVSANDSINVNGGGIIPAFEAGKFAQKFSSSANVDFSINYNILDGDYYTNINIKENLLFRPLIGLKGGWIYQNIDTNFQGGLDTNTLIPNQNYYTETVKNNFSGIGPKIGFESQWFFSEKNLVKSGFFANFSSAFLWGNWFLSDVLFQNSSSQVKQLLVGPRDFGAFMIDGMLGLKFNYKNNTLKIAYEFADWFNQNQIFDNTTGARNNDLVLQGLTIGVSYLF